MEKEGGSEEDGEVDGSSAVVADDDGQDAAEGGETERVLSNVRRSTCTRKRPSTTYHSFNKLDATPTEKIK